MVDSVSLGLGNVPAFPTFQRLLRSDGDQLLAKFKDRAQVQKEIQYFQDKAPKLKSVDDFFKDKRLMRFVLSAFSLDDEINYPGRLKKVLESKVADSNSLANRLRDPRYGEMARTMLFGDLGVINFSSPTFMNNLVDRYVTSEYEKDLGNQNPALREAAYFLRKIGGVNSSLDILGDSVLRKVVTETLDLPQEIALQSIQRQQLLIDTKIDVKKFKVDGAAALGAHSVDTAKQDVTALDSALGIASKAATQVQSVIARLQALKDDYARAVNIQNPAGPFAAEIPTQEAAAPGLTRQSGLLAAAGAALSDIGVYTDRMSELVALARDPANAGDLADYKTEFADLAAAVSTSLTSATFTYDDTDAGSAGTAQNLLDGTQPTTISVQIKSTGETIDIHGHDLTGMLTSIAAANTAFQAVSGAADTANLDAAMTASDAAEAARNGAAITVTADKAALQEGMASVTQWAVTLNTSSLYVGYQSLRDAGSRIGQINVLLGQLRGVVQESAARGAGADRTDLTTKYDELKTQISSLVSTAGAGVDNLLTGATQTYELFNQSYLTARGRDLTGSVVTPLAGADISTQGGAQTLLDAIDATILKAGSDAAREVGVDVQPFALAATTLDPRSAVDSRYRALSEDMATLVKAAAVGNTNLLTSTQSDITVNAQTSGHRLTLSARTTFDTDVTQVIAAGAALLPSSAADTSGAIAKLDEAMFNANRALSLINADMRALNLERSTAQAVIAAGTAQSASAKKEPFKATAFALKFVQKYLVKKDNEALSQDTGLSSLLFPLGNSGFSAAISSIATLSTRGRINFIA